MITEKILLVDDEPHVLQGYKRSLRNNFDLEIAVGPKEGIEAISSKGPFAVVVSDMQMPEMDGIQLLTQIKKMDPDTVRIMLTGNADQGTAVKAINEGNIFRFLTKPCSGEQMGMVLNSGIEQYRLITAERELLEQTLNGSITMLTEILSLFHPELFGRSTQIRDLIRKLSKSLNIPTSWDMEAASMLSQIGYLGLPPDVLIKVQKKEILSQEEEDVHKLVPEIGGHLLANIPRLSSVSNIVLYQNKYFNGLGFPDNSVKDNDIPIGARILKVLSDLLDLEETGVPRNIAIDQLKERIGWYDPKVLNKVSSIFREEEKPESVPQKSFITVSAKELRVGDIIRSDITADDGVLLLKKGQSLSTVQLERIRNCDKIREIVEPIQVEKPEVPPDETWSQV